jgi:uncharacterized membrane protein YdjX (TVP38/TMEM64 family)
MTSKKEQSHTITNDYAGNRSTLCLAATRFCPQTALLMKKLRSFLPLLILIAIGVALFFSGVLDRFAPAHLASEQARLQTLIGDHPIRGALIHIGAVALAVATGLPGMFVLIMAGGMLFGVVVGTLLNVTGSTLGATILFLASRHAFGDRSHDEEAPGLVSRLRGGYLAQPVSYTFFLRLVPFFPFGGVTVALAWLRCPLPLFVTTTALGSVAMNGIETWLGASVAKNIGTNKAISTDLLHDPQVLWPMLGLVLLALVPLAVNKLRAPKTAAAAPTSPEN